MCTISLFFVFGFVDGDVEFAEWNGVLAERMGWRVKRLGGGGVKEVENKITNLKRNDYEKGDFNFGCPDGSDNEFCKE